MGLSTSYSKAESDIQLSKLKQLFGSGLHDKPLKISDPTPTALGGYVLSDVGTYSFGTTEPGKWNVGFLSSQGWEISTVDIGNNTQAFNNISFFEDLQFPALEGAQCIFGNTHWIVGENKTSSSTDLPGESDKWLPLSPVLKYTAGKNLFDKNNVLTGFEVHSNGSILPESNSITSSLIPVDSTQKSLIVSGLQANTGQYRYYRFLDENESLISVEPFDAYYIIVDIPINAKYFQMAVKQRNTAATNIDNVQIEHGVINTEFETYKEYIDLINGDEINIKKNYEGLTYAFIGDSKVQTGNPDVLNFGWGVRENFPIYLLPKLKASGFRNYARSGASFKEYSGQLEWQKISRQITQLITDKATFGEPDVIIVGCGTNDGISELGNYTTAMSKTINNLDFSLTADAMRSAFYRLQEAFPNSKIIYGTYTQRADVESETWQPLFDLSVKMAGRYGAYIANVRDNSGIVKDFEIWGAVGRDLDDGLHPKPSGQIKESLVYERLVKFIFQ